MGRFNAPTTSLNGGEIGREVMGRINIEGYQSTGSIVENFLLEGAGPMSYRPGLKFCVQAPTVGDPTTSGDRISVDFALTLLTTFEVALPDGIREGDLILILFAPIVTGGDTTHNSLPVVTGDGFTTVFSVNADEPNHQDSKPHLSCLWKIADGSEDGFVSITITLSNPGGGEFPEGGTWVIYGITGVDPDNPVDTATYQSANGGPLITGPNYPVVQPEVDAPWGTKNTMWITGGWAVNHDNTTLPSGYTADVAASQFVTGHRIHAVEDEAPGYMTIVPGVYSGDFILFTIGINPSTSTITPTIGQAAESDPANLNLIHPFVYRTGSGDSRSAAQKYLMLFGDESLRFLLDGGIVEHVARNATVVNPTFAAGLAGWTSYCLGGSTAVGGISGLVLFCDGPNQCGIKQQIPVTDTNAAHGIHIEVSRGTATLKLGNFTGNPDDLTTIELRAGSHRLSYTPSGSFYIDFSSTQEREAVITSCYIVGPGYLPQGTDLILPTPWLATDARSLRFTQSLNVMYVAEGTQKKFRVEHRGDDSWSLTLTDEEDGPFEDINTDSSLLLTPFTRKGNNIMSASKSFFLTSMVGQLFRLTQQGQYQARTVNGSDQWTSPGIKVDGVGSARSVTWQVIGAHSATVRLQRSVGNDFSYEDVTDTTTDSGTFETTGTGNFAYQDGQDNATIYYRVGVKSGEYSSGSFEVTIYFPGGSTQGVCRVTGYNSDIEVDMEVLSPFAALTGTSTWEAGSWNNFDGWPRAHSLHDGRLWNFRDAGVWGSQSEAYESQLVGDALASNAVVRTIAVVAESPSVVWAISLGRLVVGCEAGEVVIRSSSLDEGITPTNCTVREMSTFGSKDIQPVKIDTRAVYVDRSGFMPMEVFFDAQAGDYVARPLSRLHRDIGRPEIMQVAAMRRPETRVFFIRSDGQCIVKLYDPVENTHGWCRFITENGYFESVAVLPGVNNEDEVYFVVRRAVGGQWVKYLEKMDPIYLAAIEDANRLDSYVRYESDSAVTQVPADTAIHLAGEAVRVFADGADMGTNIIDANGQLTTELSTAKSNITIGYTYTARYQTSKLALGAQAGTALGQRGRPSQVAFLLLGSTRAVQFGGDFTTMDPLPQLNEDEVSYDAGPGIRDETTQFLPIPMGPNNDPRFCLRVNEPLPVTIQGYVLGFHLDERVQS